MNAAWMEQAVAPNLLDAVADPDLVLTLVLANLMSPRLWELADRVRVTDPAGASDAERIQHVIDRHYEHVTPSRIFSTNGVLDLEREAARLGQGTVDYAIDRIRATFEWRVARGAYPPEAADLDRFRQRQLPAYAYATIDEARAYRRLMRGRKHKPLGVTCCLDETALFASLMAAHHGCPLDDLAFLGSPAHCTALVWTKDDSWWFYGKRDLFSRGSWRALLEDTYHGDGQGAFDDRLPNIDRITTTAGTWRFDTATRSFGSGALAELAGRVEGFFGGQPAQVRRAIEARPEFVRGIGHCSVFAGIAGASDGADVQRRLRDLAADGHAAALRALYAFRSLDVPEPAIYLRAARRATLIDKGAPALESVDGALVLVAGLEGSDSIFDDEKRVAMPDETLRFRTGSGLDKALLLHVLLERVETSTGGAPGRWQTVLTDRGSYVTNGPVVFSAEAARPASTVEGEILVRIAD